MCLCQKWVISDQYFLYIPNTKLFKLPMGFILCTYIYESPYI